MYIDCQRLVPKILNPCLCVEHFCTVYRKHTKTSIECTHDHQEYCCWAQHRGNHQKQLIDDVEIRNAIIDDHDSLVFSKKIDDIGNGGRNPPTTLIEKLLQLDERWSSSILLCYKANEHETIQVHMSRHRMRRNIPHDILLATTECITNGLPLEKKPVRSLCWDSQMFSSTLIVLNIMTCF